MPTTQQQIKCPKCGETISIDDVLTAQIETRIRQEVESDQLAQKQELEKAQTALAAREADIKKKVEEMDSLVASKVSGLLEAEKLKLAKEARTQAEKEQASKTAMLEEELKDKAAKLEQANKNEVELRKEKLRLEDDKKAFEVEKQRQLDAERQQIQEQAAQKAAEEQHHVIAQLQKKLDDATKAKDELARKLEQGSQQTQGETLELEIENLLRAEFIFDEIIPVPKGMSGADIIQRVKSRGGQDCGQIIWESKQTKAWSPGWVQKLKDDQRAVKADIAVIVSAVLPPGVTAFGFHESIWVCDIRFAVALASALRHSLESVSHERALSVGKNEKMESLYRYLTGVEFRQRIESIVEALTTMKDGLDKEKRAYEKIWSEREQQIKRLMSNSVGMYGDMNGLVGLPAIKALELGDGK